MHAPVVGQRYGRFGEHAHMPARCTHLPFQHRTLASTGHRCLHSSALTPHVWSAHRSGFAAGHGHAVSLLAQLASQHLNGALAGHCTLHSRVALSTHMRVCAHRVMPLSGHGHSTRLARQLESAAHCTSLLAHRRHSLASDAHVPDAWQKKRPAGHTGPHARAPDAVSCVRHRVSGHLSPASYCPHGSGTHFSCAHVHSAVDCVHARSVVCIMHVTSLPVTGSPVAGSTLPTAGVLLPSGMSLFEPPAVEPPPVPVAAKPKQCVAFLSHVPRGHAATPKAQHGLCISCGSTHLPASVDDASVDAAVYRQRARWHAVALPFMRAHSGFMHSEPYIHWQFCDVGHLSAPIDV